MTVLKTRLVRIGNSQGIRIPKDLVHELRLGKEVEVAVEERRLVIRSAHRPRAGWAGQFRRMARNGDDTLLDAPTPTKFDGDEWEW